MSVHTVVLSVRWIGVEVHVNAVVNMATKNFLLQTAKLECVIKPCGVCMSAW